MVRKALALLSLCCIVMSAFIGVLSYSEMQNSERRDEAAQSITCESVIDDPPLATQTYELTDFVPGKFLADFDLDQDGDWDALSVPLFPRKRIDVSRHYRAVIVCFKGVKNREELEDLMDSESLTVTFWPERQTLDDAIHSTLAQRYKRMDFEGSPVMLYGFEKANPVLGESTLKLSKYAGGGAAVIFVLSLLSMLIRTKPKDDELQDPRQNRAGLPTSDLASAAFFE